MISKAVASVTVLFFVCSSLAQDQVHLSANVAPESEPELLLKLKTAKIIPQVIDTFMPLVNVSISWNNATADLGNSASPADLQKAPSVQLVDWPTVDVDEDFELRKTHKSTQLTLALTDPDAPSYDDPKWAQVCHWIATGFRVDSDSIEGSKHATDVMPYKPPGPPPKTGPHRYIFVALAPKNGTSKSLHLTKPEDRQHWGYDGERMGVREWAEENGLGVIGANFVYAENAEQ